MSRKLLWALSLLIVASMVLAACQPAAPSVPTDLKTLRVNLGTYPDIIDPQKSSFVNEIAHLKLIYEGLTALNSKLETVAGAAESWEYNADATQLTFTLRKNLKYSDGTLLNAKRFEYSILRNIDPATAGEYAGITDDIKGAYEWRSVDVAAVSADDQAKLKEAVGVKALDSKGNACTDYEQKDCTTLQVTLAKPAPYFHTVMSLWVTYPAKEELITEGGETWWNDATYHIGNGPMILSELDPSNRGYFTPNPYYWRGIAKVNLEFKYIVDTAVSFEAYKNGEFDIVPLGAEDLATVRADATLNAEAMIYPGSCTYNLNFHRGKPPFDDPAVREAFQYSFDRAGWVTDVLKDLGAPTQTWIPKGFPGYDATEDRYAYDPAKTVELLNAAGYTIEGGKLMKAGAPIELVLTFSDTPRNRTRNEWIAGKWKTDLGLEVGLNPVEATTYTAISKDVETAPQFFIMGWCADYPDPQNWLSVYWMSTTSFASRIAYTNPELDAKMQEADVTLDAEKRMALYAEAQKMLVGSNPGIFIWNNVNSYLVKPNVKGITSTPQDAGWPGDVDILTITLE
jgi:oligopeptide transport system substrate-binding protein